MKKLILLLCVFAVGCEDEKEPVAVNTTGTVILTSEWEWWHKETLIEDEHGHRDHIKGIWGVAGENINVTCKNGFLSITRQ